MPVQRCELSSVPAQDLDLRFTWCRIDAAIVAHARFVPRDIDIVFMTPEQAEVRIHSRRMSSSDQRG